MPAVQIAFFLINLAIPYWFWVRSPSKTLPKVEWELFDKNVARLIDNAGTFAPCATRDLAAYLHKICEDSRRQWSEDSSTRVEKTADSLLFSCEVRAKEVILQWRPESTSPEPDMNCEAPHPDRIALAPSFHFDRKGRLQKIEYSGRDGARQTSLIRNCRRKLSAVKALTTPPRSKAEFLGALGQLPGDPADYISANMICLLYDVPPQWAAWRRKYGDL
ncbi:MAG: hypothetical protein HC902_10460 [Calothrix sp. SM1_5_4]|nr:hypothetical protein [Calothrix sp. SM1_5_4]